MSTPQACTSARAIAVRALPARRGGATVRSSRRRPRASTRCRGGAARAGTSRRRRRRSAASRGRSARRGRRASRAGRSEASAAGRPQCGSPRARSSAYAAIDDDATVTAPRITSRARRASPGRSKSWRRAISSTSTIAEASVPWLKPCRTWIAVESSGDRRRHLPRPVAPAREPARGDEHRDRREDAGRVRERADCVRGEASAAVRVSRPGSTPWTRFSSPPSATTVATTSGARRPRRARASAAAPSAAAAAAEVDELQAVGRVERRAHRDLAHDGDRDADLQVAPDADAEPEDQRRRQPLDARPARIEAEERRGDAPDERGTRASDTEEWRESSSSGSARPICGPGTPGWRGTSSRSRRCRRAAGRGRRRLRSCEPLRCSEHTRRPHCRARCAQLWPPCTTE